MADPKQTKHRNTSVKSLNPATPAPVPPQATTPPAQPAAAEPHPSSSHRTPREIAKDEAGPGGPSNEPQVLDTLSPSKKPPSKEDQNIRAAVQRSAHRDRKQTPRRPTDDPTHHSTGR